MGVEAGNATVTSTEEGEYLSTGIAQLSQPKHIVEETESLLVGQLAL
jgi:hypothetical protein